MSRTRILISVLVLVALLQIFPGKSALIKLIWVCAGAILVAWWGFNRYLAQHRRISGEADQSAKDDADYQRYREELNIIRTKHDPHRDLDDPTSIADEYRDELNALHEKHRAMLERKFGPR